MIQSMNTNQYVTIIEQTNYESTAITGQVFGNASRDKH